jgi:large subunit ribosomal protein L33
MTRKCAGFCLQNLDFGLSEARLPGKCAPGLVGARFQIFEVLNMAKAVTIKVKLVSSADTGFYYVAKKNSRTMTDKLVKKKYDPVARKHVEFRESKIK